LTFVHGGVIIIDKRFIMRLRSVVSSAVLLSVSGLLASAQMVVSAHSGTLHYFDGDVSIDGVPVTEHSSHFTELKEQSVLRTGRGRAELLLTPGVFLRIGENSAVRLLDNRLVATRVDLVSGSATLESDTEVGGKNEGYKTSPVTLLYKSYSVQPVKDGLIEITADPARVRVFKGEARVETADNHLTVKDGHDVFLSSALATDKFDEKNAADDNVLWARDRSSVISAANMSSARTIGASSGYANSGYGLAPGFAGGWYFNPYFDMFTYMPMMGMAYSPFGFGFYSPMMMNALYTPYGGYWVGGGGARTGTLTGRPVSGLGPGGIRRPGTPPAGLTNIGNRVPLTSSAQPAISRGGMSAGNVRGAAMGGARGGSATAASIGGSHAGGGVSGAAMSGGGHMAGGGARGR
jgi:hypothetical protein